MTREVPSIDYASPKTARFGRGWLGYGSLLCSLLLPVLFILFPFRFSYDLNSESWITSITTIWIVSSGGAVVLAAAGLWRGRVRSRAHMLMCVLGLILGAIDGSACPKIRDYETAQLTRAYRVWHVNMECEAQLKNIATAIDAYAIDNDSRYPVDLETLVAAQYLKGDYALVCPAATTGVNQNSPRAPFYYIYLEPGPRGDRNPKRVVVYERASNHPADWGDAHFLTADGTVKSLRPADADKVTRQLEKGINPPQW